MTAMHYLGAFLVLLVFILAGIRSGKKVKSAGDYISGSRRAGTGLVAGCLIGSLAGGAMTVGTAQMAFSFGFSAWWLSLGAGLGCLALGGFFAGPLYRSGAATFSEILARRYGQTCGTASALLCSLGNFMGIAAQMLAAMALFSAMSDIGALPSVLLIAALMLCNVLFGGVWGAGIVGMFKTVLLTLFVGGCGLLALFLQGGLDAFQQALPTERYFSLLARGTARDLGSGLSMIVGVLSTQAYIQAAISARSLAVSRSGVLLGALFMPLLGLAGVFVGMYMKLNYTEINPALALPLFMLERLPALLGGVAVATLLITMVGAGAGLALGTGAMLGNDLYKAVFRPRADGKHMLRASRLIVAVVLLAAGILALANAEMLILDWSYLAMALRGAVAFLPLCAALFWPKAISGRFVLASMILTPCCVLFGGLLLPEGLNPLFPALLCSALLLYAGRKPGGN